MLFGQVLQNGENAKKNNSYLSICNNIPFTLENFLGRGFGESKSLVLYTFYSVKDRKFNVHRYRIRQNNAVMKSSYSY